MTWQEALMGGLGIALFGVVLVVVIIQVMATWRARMAVAREEGYRQLVEQSTKSQLETARRLEKLDEELTEVRKRTAELERLLKEVGEPWQH